MAATSEAREAEVLLILARMAVVLGRTLEPDSEVREHLDTWADAAGEWAAYLAPTPHLHLAGVR